ncbi:hypothetical protein [Hymenobacter guriensis]|uniref:Uncharacterized protein n=1 Tax=Hymenobacter guriensis TaxID=2793065 RepID=A0ABS0L3I1_9BACT|nr:hypothetical protein [Hymenobacter guriensis]MBG8554644.1 hypothetical protein [Hymenobacter guriensis]
MLQPAELVHRQVIEHLHSFQPAHAQRTKQRQALATLQRHGTAPPTRLPPTARP